MIEYKQGSIFYQNVDALVNPVNCVGVMGAGLARHFKQWHPENFIAYRAVCRRCGLVPGMMFTFAQRHRPLIINFPTKYHWRDKSLMKDIDSGLVALREEVESREIRSIAIPKIGCGLGGLKWREVRQRIEEELGSLVDVQIVLLGPGV